MADVAETNVNKNDIKDSFIMCFLYIFVFIFKGFIFTVFKSLPYLYNVISGKADRAYTTVSSSFMTEDEKREIMLEEQRKQRMEKYNKLPWVKSRNEYYEKEKQKLLAGLNTDGAIRSDKAIVYK